MVAGTMSIVSNGNGGKVNGLKTYKCTMFRHRCMMWNSSNLLVLVNCGWVLETICNECTSLQSRLVFDFIQGGYFYECGRFAK